MKIGDLVKIVNEWTAHNPWMTFPEDNSTIGLVTFIGSLHSTGVATVLLFDGREVVVSANRCFAVEATCK